MLNSLASIGTRGESFTTWVAAWKPERSWERISIGRDIAANAG